MKDSISYQIIKEMSEIFLRTQGIVRLKVLRTTAIIQWALN